MVVVILLQPNGVIVVLLCNGILVFVLVLGVLAMLLPNLNHHQTHSQEGIMMVVVQPRYAAIACLLHDILYCLRGTILSLN